MADDGLEIDFLNGAPVSVPQVLETQAKTI